MGGQQKVKETVEAVQGLGALNRVVIEAAKDGFNFSDIAAIGANPVLIAALVRAGEGANKIKSELTELDGEDVAELTGATIAELRETLKVAGVDLETSEVSVLVDMAPEFIPLMQANIAFVVKVMARLEAVKKARAAKAGQ